MAKRSFILFDWMFEMQAGRLRGFWSTVEWRAWPSALGGRKYPESGLLAEMRKCCSKVKRVCLNFGVGARASKFCFRQGKICSYSREPIAKILTQSETKFAVRSPMSEF